MKKGILLSIAVTASTGMVLSGCGTATPANSSGSTQASGGVLTVAQSSDAVTLDTQKTNDLYSAVVMDQIYNTLINLSPSGSLSPGLAVKWQHVNTNTWKFWLRQGVKFQNGDALTAQDVKFTFDRLISPKTASPGAFVLAPVKSVQVLTPDTFEITTSRPFAPILYNLTHVATSILDENAVTKEGASYGQNPVGTGPFEFVSWVRNSKIVLKRNPNYYAGPAKLSGVTFDIIPESATASAELQTGQVDMVLQMPPSQISQFKGNSSVVINKQPGYDLKYLSFDNRVKPFNNPLVRQAISYAVDKQSLVKVGFQGAAVVANGPLPPNINGAEPGITSDYSYNPQKAKQLLAQAGYPNGFTTSLYMNSDSLDQQIATILQSQLGAVGIKLNLVPMQWGAFLNKTAEGVPMFILDWITVTGDADNGMYALWNSVNFGGPGNRSFYKDPSVDQLLNAGQSEFDTKKRLNDYAQAQDTINKDAPAVFMAVADNVVGMRSNVQGFENVPTENYKFYSVNLK